MQRYMDYVVKTICYGPSLVVQYSLVILIKCICWIELFVVRKNALYAALASEKAKAIEAQQHRSRWLVNICIINFYI